jgi:acetylglutamate kinase
LGLSGKDANLLKAKRLKRVKRDATTGFEVEMDLGFVGDPIVENPGAIEAFMRANMIPVIAPLAQDDEGQTYNINADTVAGEIAGALKAERLLLLTDIAGLMNKQGELITEIDADGVRELLADGTIKGGMIPKVETCLSALAQGVEGAVILDGRLPRALLLEIFTEHGAGTMIRA